MHLPWPSLALAAALAINSKSIAAFTPPSSATISSSSSLKSVGTSTPATFFLLHARKAQNSNNEDANDEDVKREKVAVNPAKRAALDGVLQRIERNYGRGSIVMLGNADRMNVDCIGTGSMTLGA
jgi:hypothetical protein